MNHLFQHFVIDWLKQNRFSSCKQRKFNIFRVRKCRGRDDVAPAFVLVDHDVLDRDQVFSQLKPVHFRHLDVRNHQAVEPATALFLQVQSEKLQSILRLDAHSRLKFETVEQHLLQHVQVELHIVDKQNLLLANRTAFSVEHGLPHESNFNVLVFRLLDLLLFLLKAQFTAAIIVWKSQRVFTLQIKVFREGDSIPASWQERLNHARFVLVDCEHILLPLLAHLLLNRLQFNLRHQEFRFL